MKAIAQVEIVLVWTAMPKGSLLKRGSGIHVILCANRLLEIVSGQL